MIEAKNISLYLFIIVISAGLLIIALGPGLIGGEAHRWQHTFFELLCHQDPNRSYSIDGLSMAVCARCLGIYSAFFVGIMLLPVIARIISYKKRVMIILLILSISLNAVDIVGNFMGIWVNTLESRLVLGSLFGISTAMLFTNEFFTRIKTSEETYGTEFTA